MRSFVREKKRQAAAKNTRVRRSSELEEFGFADLSVVGAEKSFAFAPAATAGEDAGTASAGFGDKVSAVGDELGVETEDGAESAFDLFGRVVVALESTDGTFDEFVEGG